MYDLVQQICENSKKHWKTNGFPGIFQVPGEPGGSENLKKSMKIGLERLSEAKNEAKRGPGRLRERKMSPNMAPTEAQIAPLPSTNAQVD